ncbi:MAG: DEAD/DEAH box helicase [Chlorobi bacterium]|nr:DEAD/DEAH box helicase [Chlorobiota bacterium]
MSGLERDKNPADESRSTLSEELRRQELEKENARLKALLEAHNIPWHHQEVPVNPEFLYQSDQHYRVNIPQTNEEKVALFMELFRGRRDMYAFRWESGSGKSGYSPACANAWRPGVCGKPARKCSVCDNRELLPVDHKTIHDHLAGRQTVGIYPLLKDDTCWFLATDFDEESWRDDAQAFLHVCAEFSLPATLEISRSGNGAHVWIFFSEPVLAREARFLGAAIVSATCRNRRQLSLKSYDRFFPNQDILPKGGFGNLIALPLQAQPRCESKSVFVDNSLQPYRDQWAHLASVERLSKQQVSDAIARVSDGTHPIDVAFVDEEDALEPWNTPSSQQASLTGPLPETVRIVQANQLFIEKDFLGQTLANRLIRIAAFQNPEFHKAQAMRLPVWDKPRIISCAENYPNHLGLPRGCIDAVTELLNKHHINVELTDERLSGGRIETAFTGSLRKDQQTAMTAILRYDTGILCAPTAFGKTVTAAAIIAKRLTSTLILVHRSELQRQWKERLNSFLELSKGLPGLIGGGKNKPTGVIDIALMQTLSRQENLASFLDRYGQIIVDECHHLSAFSFEKILKAAKARYVLGLTATPVRRDGHQPIIFMQCGPIRHRAKKPENAPALLEVYPRSLEIVTNPEGDGIQALFKSLVADEQRNHIIVNDAISAYGQNRNILVLTERTEHLERLRSMLEPVIPELVVLHGRMSAKQRKATIERLGSLDETQAKIILSTGRLIGEGFDYPPLDTLLLAMPVSWKGTLQQYAGRLHRHHLGKGAIHIYDYIDSNQPQLVRMWQKRRSGYLAMGYLIQTAKTVHTLQIRL